MTSRVSIQTVAKRAGVSTATISRVLNNRPGTAEATRQRVLSTVAELGYDPDNSYRRFFSSVQAGTRTIAFSANPVIGSYLLVQDGFYTRHLVAVQQAIEKNGYYLMLTGLASNGNLDTLRQCVREGRVDGVIAECQPVDELLELRKNVPVVLLNQPPQGAPLPAVIVDLDAATREQVQYLRSQGHRRIAMFKLRPGVSADRCFWRTYEECCEETGFRIPAAYLATIQFVPGGEGDAVARYLDAVLGCDEPPTAILTFDVYAGELIRQLGQRGRKVPGDVSVIGFDDFLWDHPCPIPLTTYRQDFETMGRLAVRMLMEYLKAPEQPPRTVQVPGRLIVRGSTAPCRERDIREVEPIPHEYRSQPRNI